MGILIASGNKGKRHTSHSPTRTAVLLRGRGTVRRNMKVAVATVLRMAEWIAWRKAWVIASLV
eukprot:1145539-Pelagomonas_calceolata.AAC.1